MRKQELLVNNIRNMQLQIITTQRQAGNKRSTDEHFRQPERFRIPVTRQNLQHFLALCSHGQVRASTADG
jgi:hypothetical protein